MNVRRVITGFDSAMTELKEFFGADVDIARMHQDRRSNLAESMRVHDVDVLVLVDPLNVEYASGVSRENVVGTLALVTADQAIQTFAAPPESLMETLSPFMPDFMSDRWDSTARQIADVLGRRASVRVAIDRASMACLRSLQQELGHPKRAEVTDGGAAVVSTARVTKTAEEVECLRRSNRAMGFAMDAVRAALKPGSTFMDLIEPMREAFAQLDPHGDLLSAAGAPAATAATPGLMYIASPTEGYHPGGEPTFPFPPVPSRPFETGDVVWPDSGLGYLGLESDYGRTWIVGDPSPTTHQRDQFNRWLEVRDRMVEVLRPGRTIADAVAAARSVGGGAPWLSQVFLAHGTGLATEYPFLGYDPEGWLAPSLLASPAQMKSLPRDDEIELTPGTVLVLEPVIWDELGGYRAEDTYVVTESEPELLSQWSYAPFD